MEAKRKDVKMQGVRDFPKGRKEKANENDQVKTGRSKTVTEKKERKKRKNITSVEQSASFNYSISNDLNDDMSKIK